MLRWKTKDVVSLLLGPDVEITINPPGGDCDTERLHLVAKNRKSDGDFLNVVGFRTDINIPNPSDVDVEMVELSDGQDSRGGLNSSDPATCALYGRIISTLRKAGFEVVPQLRDYF